MNWTWTNECKGVMAEILGAAKGDKRWQR